MLARVLTLILFCEVFVYSGYAVARVVLGRWAPWFAIVFILGMPVLARGLIALATFGLAWLKRTPRGPTGHIGARAALLLMLREWLVINFHYGFGQAFESTFTSEDRLPRTAASEVPLLLVHGYLCNRGVWWWLKRRLERAGHVVATITLEPVLGDIDSWVAPLHRRIEEVCVRTGAERVSLIAHSMGGLALRAYLRTYGDTRAARLITIATPHRGSWFAHLGPGRNAQQMLPDSEWLAQLAQTPLPAGMPAAAIYSLHDNFIAPQENAALPGAQAVPVAGRGHNEMLVSPLVFDLLQAQLARAPRTSAAEPATQK